MNTKQEERLQALGGQATLPQLQAYLQQVLPLRGFGRQTAKEKMLLLMEEVGELAKALRKEDALMPIDRTQLAHYGTVEGEAADVAIILLSLCNVLGIDLEQAILAKEAENCRRRWS